MWNVKGKIPGYSEEKFEENNNLFINLFIYLFIYLLGNNNDYQHTTIFERASNSNQFGNASLSKYQINKCILHIDKT